MSICQKVSKLRNVGASLDIDPRLALPCVFVSHFLCAVTNVAVTSAAEPFDVIVGCNTFAVIEIRKYYHLSDGQV